MTIDINKYIHPKETALVGPKSGADLVEKLEKEGVSFPELEKKGQRIAVIIPDRIVSMNKSYFLAAWGERVSILGEKKFNELYDFQTSDHIKKKIQRHVSYIKNLLGGSTH